MIIMLMLLLILSTTGGSEIYWNYKKLLWKKPFNRRVLISDSLPSTRSSRERYSQSLQYFYFYCLKGAAQREKE